MGESMDIQLLDVDFGPPLHSFVIPGEMHHIEEEVVQTFRVPNQPSSSCSEVEDEQVLPPPSTVSGAAVTKLDPAAVSAAVSTCGVSVLCADLYFARKLPAALFAHLLACCSPFGSCF